MSLKASYTPSNFEAAQAGNHPARCYQVIDLGIQTSEYSGEIKTQPKVRLGFELPRLLMENGKPFVLGTTLTLSLHPKAKLRILLESWRGRVFTEEELGGFDLFNILGVAAMVNVTHNTKGEQTYANIEAIAPMPAGLHCPPAVNEPVKFSIDEFDEAVYAAFPEWLRKKINATGQLELFPRVQNIHEGMPV